MIEEELYEIGLDIHFERPPRMFMKAWFQFL